MRYVELSEIGSNYVEITEDRPELFGKATAYTFEDDPLEEGLSKVHYYIKQDTPIYSQLPDSTGYVYILSNAGSPGILKIGMTERTPEERVKELNKGTGVVVPWELLEAFPCSRPGLVEKDVHEKLSKFRLNKHREGFLVSFETAKNTILDCIEHYEKRE